MFSFVDSFSKSRITGNCLSLIVRSDNSFYLNFLNLNLSIEFCFYFYTTDYLLVSEIDDNELSLSKDLVCN